MGLAFVGIGLAEFFERRKIDVLATPLRRTGVLLAAHSAAGVLGEAAGGADRVRRRRARPRARSSATWRSCRSTSTPTRGSGSSPAALYGLRRAVAEVVRLGAAGGTGDQRRAVVAAGAPRGAVRRPPAGVGHPAGAHRARLGARQPADGSGRTCRTGCATLGVAMIYVASAGGHVHRGRGAVGVAAGVLAVFCVAGVLAGIMMRVRAFLFLGVGFLLLDIFAMIWHAAVDLQADVGLVRLGHRAGRRHPGAVRGVREAEEQADRGLRRMCHP